MSQQVCNGMAKGNNRHEKKVEWTLLAFFSLTVNHQLKNDHTIVFFSGFIYQRAY